MSSQDQSLEHQGEETADHDELYKVRHSLAHVMAQAVLEMRPGSTLGFGPPIRDGFYYDFILTTTGSIKEAGVEVNVEQHHRHCTGKHRHYRNQQVSRNQPRPDEHRHFHQGHAWRTHVQNGRDDVDAAHNG